MKTAIGTVIYEAAYKYSDDFVETINNQSNEDFDLLVINDDLSLDKCNQLKNRIDKNVIIEESYFNSTVVELRVKLLREAKNKKYDLLILLDFDDTISLNRVEEIVLNFDSKYSFFYNDLYRLDNKKFFLNDLPVIMKNIDPILEHNFLGLTNTALNMKKIDFDFLDYISTKETIAFDWMLFSLLLLYGKKGKKIFKCQTYYRIHGNNIAGESTGSMEDLKKEIKVKISHYSNLKDFDEKLLEYNLFYLKLEEVFREYKHVLLKSSLKNNYWWSLINKKELIKLSNDLIEYFKEY